MLTRSSLECSSSHYESQSSSSSSIKSLPVVLTRSRKRKSTTLHDEEMLSRLSNVSSSHSHQSRHSISSGELREIQYNNINYPCTKTSEATTISSSSNNTIVEPLKIVGARRRPRTSSTPSDVSSTTSSKSYRRKLGEHDYETRSTVSTSSSASSSLSSMISRSSSNASNTNSRRSSRRTHSDDECSVISGFSSSGIGGLDDVTPQSKYGLRSSSMVKQDPQEDCSTTRSCSLPSVCFANCDEIWDLMCKMDLKYQRNPDLFKDHPILGPQMRAILLDWIMDVCEAYKMHRETLYLAIDYLDRYLALQKNVQKAHLQLLGITCLFVAAKLEEIYPPKLKTFAYVTDGACSQEEILDMELVLMKTLKWKLTPITPATWVNIYLQILAYRNGAIICTRSGADFVRSSVRLDASNKPSDARLIKHLYDRVDYVKVIRLVDLAILDAQSLNFTYSMLSAAAIYHLKGRRCALAASGFNWDQLATCVNWMAPAATVLRRHQIAPVLPSIEEVADESRHLVQSHCISLDMLADAEALATSKICSPLNQSDGLLTPPRSGEKSGFPKRAKQQPQSRY